MRKMNRRMKGNDYILCKGNNNTKIPTPKRSKKHKMTQIPIAQLCHNINHDTNIQNIKLDETPVHTETEESLSSNEDEVEAQVQTPKNTRRQYRDRQQSREQNKCVNTG